MFCVFRSARIKTICPPAPRSAPFPERKKVYLSYKKYYVKQLRRDPPPPLIRSPPLICTARPMQSFVVFFDQCCNIKFQCLNIKRGEIGFNPRPIADPRKFRQV